MNLIKELLRKIGEATGKLQGVGNSKKEMKGQGGGRYWNLQTGRAQSRMKCTVQLRAASLGEAGGWQSSGISTYFPLAELNQEPEGRKYHQWIWQVSLCAPKQSTRAGESPLQRNRSHHGTVRWISFLLCVWTILVIHHCVVLGWATLKTPQHGGWKDSQHPCQMAHGHLCNSSDWESSISGLLRVPHVHISTHRQTHVHNF